MPQFRNDQESQLQFVAQLKEKIETESLKASKPKQPPPIVSKNPPKIIKMPQANVSKGGNDGDFLAELVKKRKLYV